MPGFHEWLGEIGLAQYAEIFRQNDIGFDILPRLSDDDLKELGLTIGQRRRLQAAIEALADEAAGEAGAGADPERTGAAENRQLTVMFCDLVGSTALSQRLDAEDYRDVIASYRDAVRDEIARYDGFIARYMGDGLLVYFGYPQAHEDDPERAARAGLSIVEAVEGLGLGLAVRIGIATGPVIVGDIIGHGTSEENAVIGEIPNLAARLQGIARPGEVVVSDGTRRLLGRSFELDDYGAQALRGLTGTVQTWRVAGERWVEDRFAATRGGRLSPLVGRDQEVALLLDRWERAKSGEGQIALLSGEAGIGKSRIVRALRERIADEPHVRIPLQCSPHHANTPFYPYVRHFERAAEFEPQDDDATRLDKLEAMLDLPEEAAATAVPLIAALLSLPTEHRYPPLTLEPPLKKQRTLECLVDLLLHQAERQTAFVVYEDIHWADPSTLEVLDRLIGRAQDGRVFALITYRPDFTPSMPGHSHVTALTLNRLTRSQCTQMVRGVSGDDRALPAELINQIVAKADGVPLFVEEVTKSLVELGARLRRDADPATIGITVPASLKDLLTARLDGLGPAKEVAQIGAVIGREFPHRLVAAVAEVPRPEVDAALDRLVKAELIFQRGSGEEAAYLFKHALIQDVAYETLLRRRRQELHLRIADDLERHAAETVVPEVLAHHLTEAGQAERAIPYWREAGRQAMERTAGREAIAHLERALELVRALPDSDENARRELDILMSLSPAYILVRGMAAEVVGTIHERAIALAERLGDAERLFRSAFGLWVYRNQHPPMRAALESCRQLHELARVTGDSGHMLQAHHVQWSTSFFLGDIETTRRHTAEGARIYSIAEHGEHCRIFGGHDPGLCAQNFAMLSDWLAGYPEQSERAGQASVEIGEALGHQFSRVATIAFAALGALMTGDFARADALAASGLEICEAHGFAFLLPMKQLKGLAELALDPGRPADAQMLQTFRRTSPAGFDPFRPCEIAILAGLQADAGRLEEGLTLVDEAFGLIRDYESHWSAAELHRRKGELLRLADGDPAAVADCFATALAIAERQGAKAWQLRAATSMASFEAGRGNVETARQALRPICAWYADAADQPDLTAARTLLSGLS